MQKINYIIVDDEPQARRLLETYLGGLANYHLCAACSNAMEAYQALQTQTIDLMFLDIRMPQITGIDLLRSLKHPPLIILTTAYAKYALDGYELNVVDYLLKPIALPRLLQSLEKIAVRQISNPIAKVDHLFLKIEGKLIRIELAEILFIEGLQNYVKIHLAEMVWIAPHTLKEMEAILANPEFMRVHRSYLVPLKKIRAVSGNRIETGAGTIPIGDSYRAELLNRLGR